MLVESFFNATKSDVSASAVDKDYQDVVNWWKKVYSKDALWVILVGLVLLILIQFVLGPFLWNNVLRKLFPRAGLGSAAWYDVFLLHIIIAIILPAIQPASWVSTSNPIIIPKV
jgi:hypothetical protein